MTAYDMEVPSDAELVAMQQRGELPSDAALALSSSLFVDAWGDHCATPIKCYECNGTGVAYGETCCRCGGQGEHCERNESND